MNTILEKKFDINGNIHRATCVHNGDNIDLFVFDANNTQIGSNKNIMSRETYDDSKTQANITGDPLSDAVESYCGDLFRNQTICWI